MLNRNFFKNKIHKHFKNLETTTKIVFSLLFCWHFFSEIFLFWHFFEKLFGIGFYRQHKKKMKTFLTYNVFFQLTVDKLAENKFPCALDEEPRGITFYP